MDDLHERQSNALFQNKHIDASFVPGRQKSHTHTHTHTHMAAWPRTAHACIAGTTGLSGQCRS